MIRAGTDRDPANGGGTELQAKAALYVMDEIAEDPKEYMERAANEQVSDAIVDVGITWIDTFGANINGDTQSTYNTNDVDALGRSLPLSVTLSDADQAGFLQFVANTGDEDAIRLEAASHYYGQQLISDALDLQDSDLEPDERRDALDRALGWAGRADGQIRQANLAWAADEWGDDNDAAKAKLVAENRTIAASNTAAKMFLSIAGTGASTAFPPAAPFISVGQAIAGPVIDGLLKQHPIPDYDAMLDSDINDALEAEMLEAPQRRNYLLAEVAIQRGELADPALLNADGSLKSVQDIANITEGIDGLDRLQSLARSALDDWNGSQPNGYGLALETFDSARDATFPAVPPSVEKQESRVSRDWDDSGIAEENLYGDNVPAGYGEDRWEDQARERFPDENYQVDQPVWEKRTNDETTNDRRGDHPGKPR